MNANAMAMLLWTQTWQIALVAGIVLTLVRWIGRDRDQLSHALLAIVLIKCIIPPIWSSPLGLMSWMGAAIQNACEVRSDDSSAVVSISQSNSRRSLSSFDSGKSDETNTPIESGDWLFRNRWNPVHASVALLCVWGSLAAMTAVLLLCRYAAFCRQINSSIFAPTHRAVQIAHELCNSMRLKRQVDVRVIDAPIGPMVVGFWRPFIVLSKSLADDLDDEDLRILIAHELMHLKRGDLRWSTLQMIATSLWWFHPWVWIASRRLGEAAERRCDEDTIVATGCKPVDYARCLLRVLEHKDRMRFVAAVPGIRPVQITSFRLERIMSLGNGFPNTKRVSWIALLIGCIVFLPGAPLVKAQTPTPQKLPLQAMEVSGQSADVQSNEPLIVKTYEVGDLLAAIEAGGTPKGKPSQTFLGSLAGFYDLPADTEKSSEIKSSEPKVMEPKEVFATPVEGQAILAARAAKTPKASPPTEPLPTISHAFHEGKLIVNATEKQHQAIREKLEERRKYGFKMVLSELMIFKSKEQPKWKDLSWIDLNNGDSNALSIVTFEKVRLEAVKEMCKADPQNTILSAPTLMSINGLASSVITSEEKARERTGGDNGTQSAVIEQSSIRIDLLPIYKEQENVFWVETRVTTQTTVSELPEVVPSRPVVQASMTSPVRKSTFIDTAVEIKLGQVLAVCKPCFSNDETTPSEYITIIARCDLIDPATIRNRGK